MSTASQCVEAVRHRGKPQFLRIDTYRLMAHSKGDDDRDPAEVKAYWDRDPLVRFARQEPDKAEQMEAAVRVRIDAAVAQAEASPYAAPSTTARDAAALPVSWQRTRDRRPRAGR